MKKGYKFLGQSIIKDIVANKKETMRVRKMFENDNKEYEAFPSSQQTGKYKDDKEYNEINSYMSLK